MSFTVYSVHPHACGEHTGKRIIIPTCIGSSPRLWGTQDGSVLKRDVLRFIPTPVGNTYDFTSKNKTVHPHACGEHSIFKLVFLCPFGSSPRLWGTPWVAGIPWTPGRFIPTPVGNTVALNIINWLNPVHPHACGEHVEATIRLLDATGSSPRLWGTLADLILDEDIHRFIPTPVGNTA